MFSNPNQTRRVLVLGGSGSLGSEICKLLKRDGSKFAFTYYSNLQAAQNIAANSGSDCFLFCDLRKHESIKSAVCEAAQQLGGLDALIQCAAISNASSFKQERGQIRYSSISETSFDEMMEVNARGTFQACQIAQSFISESGGGNIVIIGSMDGIKSVPSPVHFAMSKAALKGLVEASSKELGKKNIKVNLIAPGMLNSGASKNVADELKATYIKHSSLKRMGTPQEIAEFAVWMALENTYVNGQCILLDGGL